MRKYFSMLILLILLLPAGTVFAQDDVPSQLIGTAWTLVELNGDVPLYDASLTYQDGSFAGTTGCNNYLVPVTFSGEAIEIEAGPVTLMACPEPQQNDQETAFLIAIQSAATYTLDAARLTFFDAAGEALMVFEPGINPLMRADWVLVSLAGDPVLDGTTITADFQSDGIGGSAGCNMYSAIYILNGSDLSFSPPISTRRACQPESVMDQETRYLAALETVTRFSIVNNQLVLEDEEGDPVLVYDASGNVNLDGTEWTLIDLNGTALLPDTVITLAFEDDSIAGSTGCNRYFGAVSVDTGTIMPGPIATTRMMCEEDVVAQETAYLAVLEAVTSFTINGAQLTLSGEAGQLVFSMGDVAAELSSVMVEVTYRERIALSPDAEITVQLQDISLADAPATVLATETIVAGEGSVPFTFELSYDPATIDERNTYAVRAEIRDNDELIFTTDTIVPVITQGNPNTASITLVSVAD